MAIDTDKPYATERRSTDRSTDNYSAAWVIAILAILAVIGYAAYTSYYSDTYNDRVTDRATVSGTRTTTPITGSNP